MKLFRPSLGGSLAILNGAAWVLLFLIGRSFDSDAVWILFVPVIVLLSLPFAWIALLINWSAGFGPVVDIVVLCTVIGLNSLVWGHGLAAIAKSESGTDAEPPLDVPGVDGSAPRVMVTPDSDNPYTPPSGG